MADFALQLHARRVLAVLRLPTYECAVPVSRALLAGGISIIEFTFTGEGVADALKSVRSELGDRVTLGAGTVLHLAQADEAIAAGADFMVTPAVRPAVVAHCADRGLPVICGAFTATEVADALDAGTELIKLYPARVGGPNHIRDLAGPFPSARFVPTGGISAQNAAEYLAAGAIAVGLGASLVSSERVVRSDWIAIEDAARQLIASL